MELFHYEFLKFTFLDLIDVVVVSYIIYKVLMLIRGTRSAQIVTGLTFLLLVSFLAFWFQLQGLMWLFTNLATVGFIVLVIVFQPEIRGALAQIGHSRFFKHFFKFESNKTMPMYYIMIENSNWIYSWIYSICQDFSLGMIVFMGERFQEYSIYKGNNFVY